MSGANDSAHPNYAPPECPSPNIQTTLAFLRGFNDWDVEKLSATFDESLVYHVLPKSLGRSPRSKEEFVAYYRQIVIPLFKRFHVTVHELVEEGSAVIFHASSVGESVFGTPYANEYMISLHFVPPKEGGDGLPKISVVKEFVDSAFSGKFFSEEFAKLQAAKEAETTKKEIESLSSEVARLKEEKEVLQAEDAEARKGISRAFNERKQENASEDHVIAHLRVRLSVREDEIREMRAVEAKAKMKTSEAFENLRHEIASSKDFEIKILSSALGAREEEIHAADAKARASMAKVTDELMRKRQELECGLWRAGPWSIGKREDCASNSRRRRRRMG
ncbi:hypothetical protein H0H81_003114 [Sphagnurus paluster]|uniref:SnoaL-like domain-containing protein n=1 Tax=Sphagnurus paluster TaxID=117069 RepID=A0A9P7GLL3_9AGAR|nr:hypothetical protein H0H81_003114 [Sphagnurus paluster]